MGSMKPVTKFPGLIRPENEERIHALCHWIQASSAQQLTWLDLMSRSGFSLNDLIALFEAYTGMTPMSYVRQVKNSRSKLPTP